MPQKSPTSRGPKYYHDLFSLKGRTAIITGGAGHLGTSISKGLASFGANVVLVGRTEETLKQFVEAYEKKFKGYVRYEVCDVTQKKEFGRVVETTVENLGGVDILVNNAFAEKRKNFEDLTEREWDEGLRGILKPCFVCTQGVLPRMLERGRGSVINIASIYGFLGIDQRIFSDIKSSSDPYAAAKGAILQLTRTHAARYAARGIRFNAISPGPFPKAKPGQPGRPDYIGSLSERVPMRRVGEPDELAGSAIFLASDAASYVTGQNLVVDGGWSIW